MTWRLDAASGIEVAGRFWRMLSPRWAFQPLSGDGGARAGGRWNSAGRPALYLSEDQSTAIAEYQQDLPRPGTLTAYDVVASGILDLADASLRAAVGVPDEILRLAWKRARDIEHRRPASWDFADAAFVAGWNGVRVPSAQAAGHNLVLWRWNTDAAPTVRFIDPLAVLPRDQASWPTAPVAKRARRRR